MRIKYLACILSLLLLVGLSNLVMAQPPYIAGKVLENANAVLYSPDGLESPPPASCPEFIKLGIEMEAGSTMPGLIIWDFDVDPSTTLDTNGSNLNMHFDTCEGGGHGPWKW